jgi:hypothetical protein
LCQIVHGLRELDWSQSLEGIKAVTTAERIWDTAAISKKGMLWYLFRAPIYLYRWHLGWLFGKRLPLLAHTGRRSVFGAKLY